jgi:uncharacterized protein DUF4440
VSSDWATLEAILADDLVHIHADDLVQDKVEYLHTVRTRILFLRVDRVSLAIRTFGNFVVATGEISQLIRLRDSSAS